MSEMFYKPIDPLRLEMETKVLKNRKIYFSDEFDRETVFKALYWLERLEELDLKSGTKEPITIVNDSYGGVIYDGLALISKIEEMKESGYKIISQTRSVGMSCGLLCPITASERICSRYTTFLLHQPSSGGYGTLKDMEAQNNETKRLWDITKQIVLKYTKITEEQLDEVKRTNDDWIIPADEALRLGIVDRIL